MNILLVTYGSTGDVRPLWALGLALHRKGMHVRICAPPDSEPLFAGTGLTYAPMGGDVRRLMKAYAGRLVGRPLAAMAPMTRILKRELEKQFRQLPAFIADADLVVCSGLALATPSVAEAWGVPCFYAVSMPVLIPSPQHAPLAVPWQNLPPMCNRFLWQLAARALDLGYRSLLNRHRSLLGVPALKRVMPHLSANMVVAADRELAPLPAEAPPDCRQTGYWHAISPARLPPQVARFLDQGPPPFYIGFGSMGDARPHRTIALLRRAVRLAGVRAVIQSGWAGWHCESDLDCLCVTGDLPHAALFARVAGVVHHGGAGTTMAAARAGAPQVIVPHLLDQYYWGQRIRTIGLGPQPIPKKRMRPERLARAMRRVVTSPSMRTRARELAHTLQQRDGVEEAVRWLTALTPPSVRSSL